MLPEVCPSSHLFGYTDAKLFGGEIPIAGDAGDQQAALLGKPVSNRVLLRIPMALVLSCWLTLAVSRWRANTA